ncbi:MAG: hypothetical protein M3535_11920 [Actinomycetota bacterium]|nr:hypothetical protein [Actinomycetota bacterium]
MVGTLAGLPRPERPGLRWSPSTQWHVTLRFFGDVDVDEGVLAGQQVAEAAELGRPAVAELGPALGAFGRKILHVPVSGLEALAQVLRRSTTEVGATPSASPFEGHITLARNRGKGSLDDLIGAPVVGSWKVEEIALVASISTGEPGVPNRHEVVATFPLGSPA